SRGSDGRPPARRAPGRGGPRRSGGARRAARPRAPPRRARATASARGPRARAHRRVPPEHRRAVVALAPAAPRHEIRADALAQLLVQLVLVERPALLQRVARRRGDLVEGGGRGEALLLGQTLHLPAELGGELVVVAGDQRAALAGGVAGRAGVDRD